MSQSSGVQASTFDHELSYFRFWALRGSDQAGKSRSLSVSDTESVSPHTTRPSTTRRPRPKRSTLSSSYQNGSIGAANASKERLDLDFGTRSPPGDSAEDDIFGSPSKTWQVEQDIPKAVMALGTPRSINTRPSDTLHRDQSSPLKKPHLPRRPAYYVEPAGQVIYENIDQEREPQTASITSQSKRQIVLPFCTISFGKPLSTADNNKQNSSPTMPITDISNGIGEIKRKQKPDVSPMPLKLRPTEPTSHLVRMLRLLGSKTKSMQALKRVQTILQSQTPAYPPPKRVDTSDAIGNLLHRVSTALHNLPELWQAPDDASSKSDNSHCTDRSIASGTVYQRPSRNPRSRQFFRHYSHSQSGSILHYNLRRPRQVTPDSGAMYMGSDGQQYLRADITDPNGPTYLPSEAKRVQTPPLNEFEGRSKRRGFFFDYNTADDPKSTSLRAFNPRPTARRLNTDVRKDWYAALEAALDVEDDTRQPAVDVPDHLPSSPLCPRHPRHKSGGTGVCPVHGRNDSVGSAGT